LLTISCALTGCFGTDAKPSGGDITGGVIPGMKDACFIKIPTVDRGIDIKPKITAGGDAKPGVAVEGSITWKWGTNVQIGKCSDVTTMKGTGAAPGAEKKSEDKPETSAKTKKSKAVVDKTNELTKAIVDAGNKAKTKADALKVMALASNSIEYYRAVAKVEEVTPAAGNRPAGVALADLAKKVEITSLPPLRESVEFKSFMETEDRSGIADLNRMLATSVRRVAAVPADETSILKKADQLLNQAKMLK
jgi:hypothetical protein